MQTYREMLAALVRGAGSERRAAASFNVSPASFNAWVRGRALPDDDQARRMAQLLGHDPAYVLALVHAERSKSAETRAAWERIASAFAKAASVAALAIGASAVAVPDARASHNQNSAASGPKHTLREKRGRAWFAPLLCA